MIFSRFTYFNHFIIFPINSPHHFVRLSRFIQEKGKEQWRNWCMFNKMIDLLYFNRQNLIKKNFPIFRFNFIAMEAFRRFTQTHSAKSRNFFLRTYFVSKKKNRKFLLLFISPIFFFFFSFGLCSAAQQINNRINCIYNRDCWHVNWLCLLLVFFMLVLIWWKKFLFWLNKIINLMIYHVSWPEFKYVVCFLLQWK